MGDLVVPLVPATMQQFADKAWQGVDVSREGQSIAPLSVFRTAGPHNFSMLDVSFALPHHNFSTTIHSARANETLEV